MNLRRLSPFQLCLLVTAALVFLHLLSLPLHDRAAVRLTSGQLSVLNGMAIVTVMLLIRPRPRK